MPAKFYHSTECSCGHSLPGKFDWEAWDKQVAKHTGAQPEVDSSNPERTDYTVIILEERPNGMLRTEEWCRVHGRTEFSVKTIRTGRYRRCLKCDQERQRRKKS
jgi:hypothetical protein